MRNKNNKSAETFFCQFSDGTSFSSSVDLDQLHRTLDAPVTSVSPPPVKKHLIPEYINWMHSVMSTLATRTGRSIVYAYPSEVPDESLCIMYKPDGSRDFIPEG